MADSIWATLANASFRVKTIVSLAGLAVTVVGYVVTRSLAPDAVPAQLAGGFIGFCVMFFGAFLFALNQFPKNKRAGLTERMFYGVLITVVLLFCLALYFLATAKPKTVTIDLYLEHNEARSDQGFTVTYKLPDRDPDLAEGKKGHASLRGIPADAKTLKIDNLVASGLALVGGPEFPIKENAVYLPVMQVGPATPWSATDFPNPNPHVPSRAQLDQPPTNDPTKVLFKYVNSTDKKLWLLLYNCTDHYSESAEPRTRMARWIKLPVSPKREYEVFNKFNRGSGWYVIFACDESRKSFKLDTVNLYKTTDPYLVIREGEMGEPPYVPLWRE